MLGYFSTWPEIVHSFADKVGREALYRLSDRGRAETEAVRADVYGRDARVLAALRAAGVDAAPES